TTAADARKQAWTSYWAGGALHSCAGSFAGNYSGAIGDFWRKVFQGLEEPGRVLDLATGNGALPLLLWEQRGENAGVQIDAVDLAAVVPPWYQPSQHRGVEFHGGVAMEKLPFPDDTFDLVVSQFGLEYARWPDALHECLRVAAADGRVAFIMHHADSLLVQLGRVELENQHLLLAEAGLLDAAERVIPWIALAREGGAGLDGAPEARMARVGYNDAMTNVSTAIEQSRAPDLLVETRAWVHALVSGADGMDARQQGAALSTRRETMRAAMLRTHELVEHALQQEQLDELVKVVRQRWPSHMIDCGPITQEEGLLGWGIVAAPSSHS
ncbi:MAG: class I SAM-dependent methyltransferase, partial [Pseudoxanthomonas sp.]